MKKIIYGGVILALVCIGITACNKDNSNSIPGNTAGVSQVETDVQNIFDTYKNKQKNSSRSTIVVENNNNPLNNSGVEHNVVLDFILASNPNETNFCNQIPLVNTNFGTSISYNCNQLTSLCQSGLSVTFDNSLEYKSDLLLSLLNSSEIDVNEYDLVNTTFLNADGLSIEDRIDFIKGVENYTVNSSLFNFNQKNRILRTLAIYRYSSYYWEIENPTATANPTVVAMADAAAEYWAMNSPNSPAQDGKDVNAIAGMVSAYIQTYLIIFG